MDSQPIDAVWLDDELQLAERGSPNFTTALEGLISTVQERLTIVPRITKYEFNLILQAAMYKTVFYKSFQFGF